MFFRKKNKNVAERTVRPDKKIHVGPTVSVILKREIERLAFITDQPVKFIGEMLFYEGVHTNDILERLAPYFQRGALRVERTLYYGHLENPNLKEREDDDETDRVSIRFTQRDYEDVRLLADLLDVTPSRAVAIMLDASIRHPNIVETIMLHYNHRSSFSVEVDLELRKFMRYVKRDNPYIKRKWNSALLDIIEGAKEVRARAKRLTEKMIDRESYDWSAELDAEISVEPPKKKRK